GAGRGGDGRAEGSRSGRRVPPRLPLLLAMRDRDRQLDGERGALALARTLRCHPTAVQLDEMAHKSQPEAEPGMRAGARAVGLMETLEEMRQLLLADSLSGVTDDDLKVGIDPLQKNLNGTALRRKLHRVDKQVPAPRL